MSDALLLCSDSFIQEEGTVASLSHVGKCTVLRQKITFCVYLCVYNDSRCPVASSGEGEGALSLTKGRSISLWCCNFSFFSSFA